MDERGIPWKEVVDNRKLWVWGGNERGEKEKGTNSERKVWDYCHRSINSRVGRRTGGIKRPNDSGELSLGTKN